MGKGLEQHVELTQKIIAASYEVHNILGPGLEERFYRDALMYELELRGLSVQIRRLECRDPIPKNLEKIPQSPNPG